MGEKRTHEEVEALRVSLSDVINTRVAGLGLAVSGTVAVSDVPPVASFSRCTLLPHSLINIISFVLSSSPIPVAYVDETLPTYRHRYLLSADSNSCRKYSQARMFCLSILNIEHNLSI